jgi:16S rRNA (guanine527-N7)-methyltransferase
VPALTAAEFSRLVRAASPEALSDRIVAALDSHYRLLLRWNRQTSLVGPGSLEDAVEAHYGESLAALPLIGDAIGKTIVDVGSGAGFPGLVLAVARPAARTVLVEARERKWSFLKAVALELGMPIECVLGTVDRSLPKTFPPRVDYVTLRALKLSSHAWQRLLSTLAEDGRVLIWAGRDEPPVPPTLSVRRELPLPKARWKRILELERVAPCSKTGSRNG